jgi:hypothetical protein
LLEPLFRSGDGKSATPEEVASHEGCGRR